MNKQTKLILHFLLWILIASVVLLKPLMTYFLTLPEYGTFVKSAKYLVMPLLPVFFYLSYFGLHIFLKNKKLISIVVLFLFVLVYKLMPIYFGYGIYFIPFILFAVIAGALFKYFFIQYEQKNKIQQLEKQQLESRIGLLQSKLNPHFLFNTLNNIDSLIHTNQEKASEALVQLSDILSYAIYDSNNEFVLLSDEIIQIKKFIQLHKLRFQNPSIIKETIFTPPLGTLKIAPMLFIPFIENAFKHYASEETNEIIEIALSVTDTKISFSCLNSYHKNDTNKDGTSGIGLKTSIERLNLLYKDKFELDICQENNLYKVNLEIYV